MTQRVAPSHLPHLSQLDHLRPPPGWRTDCAVISTYSAHTPVVAAALLALAGQEDLEGSGSKVGMVRALRELRGKVHIVLQSGRLTSMSKPAPIVALLDQFIVQVPWDEGSKGLYKGRSWHAKFALVRQVPVLDSDGAERWVFMLGSRNLTMDMCWDIGLVLKAGEDSASDRKTGPQVIGGIGQLAADLAGLFPVPLKRWKGLAKTLDKLQWRVPKGLRVSEVRLMLQDDEGRSLPQAPANVHRVMAVSPFLDGTAVAKISLWGGDELDPARRQLLTTQMALEPLALQTGSRLDQYALMVLPAPQHEIILGSDEEQVSSDQMGLHAKMLLAEHGKGATFWLGSPNLTARAWARNAECYAKVQIDNAKSEAGAHLLDGLDAFVQMAREVSLATLVQPAGDLTLELELSAARIHVAASLAGAAQRNGNASELLIEATGQVHPGQSGLELSIGPLLGELAVWPIHADRLSLAGAADARTASDLLRIRLVLGDLSTEWVQLVPWDPPLQEVRDEAVLSDYLGPRQMLSWIHDVLHGFANGDEGGPWDWPRLKTKPAGHNTKTVLGLPSIDQALRMWLKDRTQLDEVDRILQLWAHRSASSTPGQDDTEVEKHLQRFSRSWQALRKGLSQSRSPA
jgi:hypothetical protein